MKEKKAAAVAAFQTAIQKVERKHGHSLRKMCKIAGVSEHAAGRAARGDIKRRINADVLAGFISLPGI